MLFIHNIKLDKTLQPLDMEVGIC